VVPWQTIGERYLTRQAIFQEAHLFGIYFSRMDEVHRSASSRKAYRSHLTRLIKKIEELTRNGTISTIEEPQLMDLIAAVEHLESKSSILLELDTKVAQAITDPEELEGDIYRAIEIQDSISEYTHRAKRIINRSERPQPPTAPPLNVNATPYQLSQGNLPNTSEEQVDAPTTEMTQSSMYPDSENTEPIEIPPTVVNTTSKSIARLPKLTLPTFSGNPLM